MKNYKSYYMFDSNIKIELVEGSEAQKRFEKMFSEMDEEDEFDSLEYEWKDSDEYRSLKKWLDDPNNFDDINYSDIFKDVYGFRPHGFRPI